MPHHLVTAKPKSDHGRAFRQSAQPRIRINAAFRQGTYVFAPKCAASRGWLCHMGGRRLLLASIGRGKGRRSG